MTDEHLEPKRLSPGEHARFCGLCELIVTALVLGFVYSVVRFVIWAWP